ncbi:hypothetical protein [Rhizorhabdus dicambivorans]|uniref:Uncharacterized protein n=1 Tax=Rhizorhabdus dicambivorans TaxID=1850238 RepID=A0A2A4FQQ7_9SPHN|nr:hypothetical protein [Rhizorhabdus dicambivorans]PCE40054.1 hypothetical protein COO09_22105 [Rhizorhabdus dicambivorans]
MSAGGEILRALKTLEEFQGEFADIAARTDDARRRELVVLRRRHAEQMAAIADLCDPFFSALGSKQADAYRQKFSRMRSATALHQAEWPAVRLNEAAEGYRSSALRVRQTCLEFITWARATLHVSTPG